MKNQTLKYFKYAIGEIVLVVIGILIALQINTWNEKRIGFQKEKTTLTKFLQDLKSDSVFFEGNIKTIQIIDTLHKQIYQFGVEGITDVQFNRPPYVRRALTYNPTARENDPNIANKINNEFIREEIQKYFRSLNEMDDSNNEFESAVLEIRSFLRANKIHNIKAWFTSKIKITEDSGINNDVVSEASLIALSKNEDFQQLLFESSLKLHETREVLLILINNTNKLIQTLENFLK
jgi:hypothetical protein